MRGRKDAPLPSPPPALEARPMPICATLVVSAPDQPGLVAAWRASSTSRPEHRRRQQPHGHLRGRGRALRDAARGRPRRPRLPEGPGAARRLGDASRARGALRRPRDRARRHWSVGYDDSKPRVAILVTKDPACLYDLILSQRSGELACESRSSCPTTRRRARRRELPDPVLLLPVSPPRRRGPGGAAARAAEGAPRQPRRARPLHADPLGGLPRGRAAVINIHHGFLPAFQGARPYHQAHARGVKLIGATAHTPRGARPGAHHRAGRRARVARSGPTIARVGRDVERVVLARAVRAHLQRRIVVEGRRTLVL